MSQASMLFLSSEECGSLQKRMTNHFRYLFVQNISRLVTVDNVSSVISLTAVSFSFDMQYPILCFRILKS